MKILVICLPRAGSTSFVTSLSKATNINLLSIPDAYSYPENISLINHVLAKEDIIFRMSPSHNIGMDLIEFSKLFDYTILLSRRSESDYYKSFVNLYYKEIIVGSGWSSKYDYDEIPSKYKIELKNSKDWKRLLNDKQTIESFSTKMNIDIIYYEDLYYSSSGAEVLQKLIPNINILAFKNYLSKTKKLRTKSIKKII